MHNLHRLLGRFFGIFPLLKVLESTVIKLYHISTLESTTKGTTKRLFETEHPKRYQMS